MTCVRRQCGLLQECEHRQLAANNSRTFAYKHQYICDRSSLLNNQNTVAYCQRFKLFNTRAYYTRASAHRRKWGQLIPWKNWWKIKKQNNSFLNGGWGWSDMSDDWLVRRQGSIDPPNQNPADPLGTIAMVLCLCPPMSVTSRWSVETDGRTDMVFGIEAFFNQSHTATRKFRNRGIYKMRVLPSLTFS